MIETRRLRLVPWPVEAQDLRGLGRTLGISVPAGWRPDVLDVLPLQPPFGPWAAVDRERTVLVGNAGFKGPPDTAGTVELGYEIAPGERRRGYATEAASALSEWALATGGASCVIAHCDPSNAASIRVLERAGFVSAGRHGSELRFELRW